MKVSKSLNYVWVNLLLWRVHGNCEPRKNLYILSSVFMENTRKIIVFRDVWLSKWIGKLCKINLKFFAARMSSQYLSTFNNIFSIFIDWQWTYSISWISSTKSILRTVEMKGRVGSPFLRTGLSQMFVKLLIHMGLASS